MGHCPRSDWPSLAVLLTAHSLVLAAVGVDDPAFVALEALPSAACLQVLQVLLELLMHEIRAETKKHLMLQLHMAAAAAAGSTGVVKPDASLTRPLKQVRHMIKAVHRMQLLQDFPAQLLAAADLSDLWVGSSCGIALAAVALLKQQGAATAAATPQPASASGSGSRSSLLRPASAVRVQQMQHQQQEGGEPAVAAADAAAAPSPKPLQPWSLYNLLFEETSESSLNEALRASLGALPPHSSLSSTAVEEDAPATAAAAAAAAAEGGSAGPADDASVAATAAELAAVRRQLLASFPSALVAASMAQLDRLPAELPLMALQVLWDARRLLKQCGLLGDGLMLLRQQEELCMTYYMQQLVPTAYEHFKVSDDHLLTLNGCQSNSVCRLAVLVLAWLGGKPFFLCMHVTGQPTACMCVLETAAADASGGCCFMAGFCLSLLCCTRHSLLC